MEKREKIMLGVLAATVVVAGAMHFSTPSTLQAPGGPAAAQLNMDELTKSVEQAKLPSEKAYRIELLTDNATGDPFYAGQGGFSQEDDRGLSGGAAEIVYSGYLKIGQKILAVINGVEYALGDELAEGGYLVQAIDKNSVLLERTDGSTGRKFTKRVPLVEDDTDKIRIRVVKKR
jgi:hypothetical protein